MRKYQNFGTMLKFFVKFSSVTKQSSSSSTINHVREFRSVSPTASCYQRKENCSQTPNVHKRSYSQPPTWRTKSYQGIYHESNKKTAVTKGTGNRYHGVGKSKTTKEKKTIQERKASKGNPVYSAEVEVISKRSEAPETSHGSNSNEMKKPPVQYRTIEQYELESAKPRDNQSAAIFNVIECISQVNRLKKSKVLQHLQPNSIKPYGSTENSYFPTLCFSNYESIKYPNTDTFEEKSINPSIHSADQELEDVNRREYSTYTMSVKSFSIKENPGFPLVQKAAKLLPKNDNKNRSMATNVLHNPLKSKSKPKAVTASKKKEKTKLQSHRDNDYEDTRRIGRKLNAEDTRSFKSPTRSPTRSYIPKITKKTVPFHSYKLPWSQNDAVSMVSKISFDQPDSKSYQLNRVAVPWPSYSERMRNLQNNNLSVITFNSNPCEDRKYVASQRRSISNDFTKRVMSTFAMSSLQTPITRNIFLDKIKIPSNLSKSAIMIMPAKERSFSSIKCPPPTPKPKRKLPVAECVPRPKDCYEEICKRPEEKVKPKKLPPLKPSPCPCIEPEIPKMSPALRRLNLVFADPPKLNVCPEKNPCPPRADDGMAFKPKKLPVYLPGTCECIEPKPQVDVPLIRLKARPIPLPMRNVKICEPEPCPPRADRNLKITPKKLSVMPASSCPCIEADVPDKSPSLRRLKMKFCDPPRPVCIEPPCGPRADDKLVPKEKKLPVYVPGDCACIELPPPADVPLVRLKPKPVQEPLKRDTTKCEPPPCPPRADEHLVVAKKKLPVMVASDCPCIEPEVPDLSPKIRRLHMRFPDPKRKECKPVPCVARADDSLVPKTKKLPIYTPGVCACIEPPPMTDIPLIRLKAKHVEPPKRVITDCAPEPCPPRADEHLKLTPKVLPYMEPSKCPCVEPDVPDKHPNLRRLKMKFQDPPKQECPEPKCVARADDNMPQKYRELPIYIAGPCKCIEPPELVDVPLIRLKPKHVEPPKRSVKPCMPEPCPPRADRNLKPTPKQLAFMPPGNCPCIEPFIPSKNPSLRWLKICPQEPPRPECPVPKCSPRADDTLKPKVKSLPIYKPKDCACIEPPPPVDVPLVRLKAKPIPPFIRSTVKCEPEPCPPRADANLKIYAKPLPLLPASSCPCIEPEVPDKIPHLRRLKMKFVDPPRIPCPIDKCVARADDNLVPKVKSLPLYIPGDCECIEPPPLKDVPLIRLKKKCVDPPKLENEQDICKHTPRADAGCWEYPPENDSCKHDTKSMKKKNVSYNSKRKYNTASNKGESPVLTTKSLPDNSTFSHLPISQKNIKVIYTAKSSRKGEDKFMEKTRVPVNRKLTSLLDKHNGVIFKKKIPTPKSFKIDKIKSMATLGLLKQLTEIEDSLVKPNIMPMINSIPPKANRSLLNLQMQQRRGFSTTSLRNSNKKSKKDKCKKKKKKNKCKKPEVKKCNVLKCPKFFMKGCKERARYACTTYVPVCCEKKLAPYPAFSECMQEEIEPFTNFTQWRCTRREYGFDPNPQKFDEPIDKIRKKRHFSSLATTSIRPYSTCASRNVDRQVEDVMSYLPLQGIKGKVDPTIFAKQDCAPNRLFSRSKSKCAATDKKPPKCTKVPKKKVCKKFHLSDCKPITKRPPSCREGHPPYGLCKKQDAPYPAFSECVDEEVHAIIYECPQEEEKIKSMQPSFNMAKPIKLLRSPPPHQGKIDPYKEEKCIRKKLCLPYTGLTQSCTDFGDSIHPMRAKDWIEKPKNKDCNYKVGKQCQKNMCTWASNNLVENLQKRGFCSSTAILNYPCILDRLLNSYFNNNSSTVLFGRSLNQMENSFKKKMVQPQINENKLNCNSYLTNHLAKKDYIEHGGLPYKRQKGLCKFSTVANGPKLNSRRLISTKAVSKFRCRIYNRFDKISKRQVKFFSDSKSLNKSKKQQLTLGNKPKDYCKTHDPTIKVSSKKNKPKLCIEKCEAVKEAKCDETNQQKENFKVLLPEKSETKCFPSLDKPVVKESQPILCKDTKKEEKTLSKCSEIKPCPKLPFKVKECKKQANAPLKSGKTFGAVCPPKHTTLWDRIVKYFKARPNCPTAEEIKQQRLKDKAKEAAKAAGLCLVEPKKVPSPECNEDPPCFPTLKKRKFSTASNFTQQPKRRYSRSWKSIDDLKNVLEEELKHSDKSKLAKKLLTTVKEGMELLEEKGYISPDDPQYKVYKQLENLTEDEFNEVILKQARNEDADSLDEEDAKSVSFSCKLMPLNSGENKGKVMETFYKENILAKKFESDELMEAFQEFCNTIEIISCEDNVENIKTRNILDEIDELLQDSTKPSKDQ